VAFGTRRIIFRWLLFGIALLVGLSRIGVGVHWPTDICAGLILGWGSAWLGWLIAQRITIRNSFIFQTILGALLIASAIVLLVDYDTHYPQTDWLSYSIGVVMLVWGVVNYVFVWRDKILKTNWSI
jgi:zinc transporter ZupT